ncbi:guanine nucleotide-exchange factor SEC12 [Lampetra planeri]
MAPPELHRAPFPLYAVAVLSDSLVVVGGGGGAAKTGIKNALHFLRVEWISGRPSASLLCSHDTQTRAVMNLAACAPLPPSIANANNAAHAAANNAKGQGKKAGEKGGAAALESGVLAVGMDGDCHVLRYDEVPAESRAAPPAEKGRQRKKGKAEGGKTAEEGSKTAEGETRNETPQLQLESLHVVQSDVSADSVQKSVRFNADSTLLATGGVDGHVRVWEFPDMKLLHDIEAHKDEVEDLDFGPSNTLVSVGRDFSCSVWQKGLLMLGLDWSKAKPDVPDKTYRFRACRFGRVADSPDKVRLYTVHIPHKRERRPPPCYVTKWEGQSFLPLLTAPCGTEVVSTFTVSESGTFLGLGTVTGSVAIYIAFSLQQAYYVRETHGIVVTELAFVGDKAGRGVALRGSNDAAMLSVGVDSRCKLHMLPRRTMLPVWLVLLCCAGLLVLTIMLIQHFFPGFL